MASLRAMLKGLLFSFGSLAAILSVIFVDQDLCLWFNEEAQTPLRQAAREITNVALGEHWFILALTVYGFARFWPRHFSRWTLRQEAMMNLRRWSIHFFCALLGSGILLTAGKWIIGRQRPHRSEVFDPLVFKPLTADWYFHSMPSGHSQVIFTVATAVSLLWPRLGWFLFPIAAGIAFTRVMTLQHFLSDVIVGALIGYFGTVWTRNYVARKVPLPDPLFNPQENR